MLAFLFGDSMDLSTAAKYLKLGYRIRRVSWDPTSYMDLSEPNLFRYLALDDLWADDWEIVLEGIVSDFPITYADEVE